MLSDSYVAKIHAVFVEDTPAFLLWEDHRLTLITRGRLQPYSKQPCLPGASNRADLPLVVVAPITMPRARLVRLARDHKCAHLLLEDADGEFFHEGMRLPEQPIAGPASISVAALTRVEFVAETDRLEVRGHSAGHIKVGDAFWTIPAAAGDVDGWRRLAIEEREGLVAPAQATSTKGPRAPSKIHLIFDRTCPDRDGLLGAYRFGRHGGGRVTIDTADPFAAPTAPVSAPPGVAPEYPERSFNLGIREAADEWRAHLGHRAGELFWFADQVPRYFRDTPHGVADCASDLGWLPGGDVYDALELALDAAVATAERGDAIVILGNSPPRPGRAPGLMRIVRALGFETGAPGRDDDTWRDALRRADEKACALVYTWVTHTTPTNAQDAEREAFIGPCSRVRKAVKSALAEYLHVISTKDANRESVLLGLMKTEDLLQGSHLYLRTIRGAPGESVQPEMVLASAAWSASSPQLLVPSVASLEEVPESPFWAAVDARSWQVAAQIIQSTPAELEADLVVFTALFPQHIEELAACLRAANPTRDAMVAAVRDAMVEAARLRREIGSIEP